MSESIEEKKKRDKEIFERLRNLATQLYAEVVNAREKNWSGLLDGVRLIQLQDELEYWVKKNKSNPQRLHAKA